jgi:hypothetical protein
MRPEISLENAGKSRPKAQITPKGKAPRGLKAMF